MKEIIKRYKYKGEKTDYKISNHGKVYSCKHGIIKQLKPIKNSYGYLVVNLYINNKPKQVRINRMVAETFIPNPNNLPQVNHINGDKTFNYDTNLEWVTAKENTRHAILTGLRVQGGEKFHSSKLSNKQVVKICKLLEKNKLTYDEIAKKIGNPCTVKMVHNIVYGNTWVDISKHFDLSKHTIDENHGSSKLTKRTVKKICKLLETTDLTYAQIASRVGNCTKYDVNHIKNRYTWKSISKDYDFSKR